MNENHMNSLLSRLKSRREAQIDRIKDQRQRLERALEPLVQLLNVLENAGEIIFSTIPVPGKGELSITIHPTNAKDSIEINAVMEGVNRSQHRWHINGVQGLEATLSGAFNADDTPAGVGDEEWDNLLKTIVDAIASLQVAAY